MQIQIRINEEGVLRNQRYAFSDRFTLVSELLDIPIYDSQCGLKLVPRACFEAIEARLKITGFAFDVELLTTLLDSGCAVVEVPISWHETPGGKVRLLRDSFLMARDVLKIKAARGSAS